MLTTWKQSARPRKWRWALHIHAYNSVTNDCLLFLPPDPPPLSVCRPQHPHAPSEVLHIVPCRSPCSSLLSHLPALPTGSAHTLAEPCGSDLRGGWTNACLDEGLMEPDIGGEEGGASWGQQRGSIGMVHGGNAPI